MEELHRNSDTTSVIAEHGWSPCSQALAREIRREPMYAQNKRELAAVMQVMLQHMPDHPGTRHVNRLAVPLIGEGVSHLVGAPSRQTIRHKLPGVVERLHQLGYGWDRRPQRKRRLIPTLIPLHLRTSFFAHEIDEPVGTAGDDVQGSLAYRAQVSSNSQLKLPGAKRRDRPLDMILVRFPGGVEHRKCEIVFSHQ